MKTIKTAVLAVVLTASGFAYPRNHAVTAKPILVPERIHYVAGQDGRINIWFTVWVTIVVPCWCW